MTKKRRGSSARGARAGKKEKGTKPKKIDFSDIPELSDKQLSSMRRVGRPTVGDEPDRFTKVQGKVRQRARGYQKARPATSKIKCRIRCRCPLGFGL